MAPGVLDLVFARTETDCVSGWANPKSGDINAILSNDDIDAFVQNPKKGTSKQCLNAYDPAFILLAIARRDGLGC
jgi:hypothetical protein